MELYHGTTHRFEKFDIKKFSVLSHVGQGIYLTSCILDVKENYAGIGPDMRQKIWNRVDEILEENPDFTMEIAEKQAKEEIVGPGRFILTCSLSDKIKLFKFGKHNYVELWSFNENEEIELTEFGHAVERVLNDYGYDMQMIFNDNEISTAKLHNEIGLICGDDFESIGEIFAEIVCCAGFDGVEYENAAEFFPYMVYSGTKHFVIYNQDMVTIDSIEDLNS